MTLIILKWTRRNLLCKSKISKSTAELAILQEKRNVLAHRITNWQKIQDIYMPMITPLRPEKETTIGESEPSQIEAERIKLFLPSTCLPHIEDPDKVKSLVAKEGQLRLGQAYDALDCIKRLRRILASISIFKHQNVSGTGGRANTRIRSLYDKFQGRIQLAAHRYRAAYSALHILDPEGSWHSQLRVLDDSDIRGPGKSDDELQGEGRRELSWIWLVGSDKSLQSDDKEAIEAMRVEWGKTRARAQRWSEEVQLLREEMRRVLEYFKWKAAWWRSKKNAQLTVGPAISNGLQAYAEKQAVILERLGQVCAQKWSAVLKKHSFQDDWQKQYDKLPQLPSIWNVERVKKKSHFTSHDPETSVSEESDIEESEEENSDVEMDDVF